jgi:hypothetical protein
MNTFTKPTLPSTRRLRLSEAAAYLGVSPRTLSNRGWRAKHRIPMHKIGHIVVFDSGHLDVWLKRHEVKLPLDKNSEGAR